VIAVTGRKIAIVSGAVLVVMIGGNLQRTPWKIPLEILQKILLRQRRKM